MTSRDDRRGRDPLIVAALAGGATYAQAAETAGVSPATVYRRMADPAFRADVAGERFQVVESIKGRLVTAGPAAVQTLDELASGATSETVRLGAARAILELAVGRRSPFDCDAVPLRDYKADVEAVLDLALEHLPEEGHRPFVQAIQRLTR